MTENHIWNNIIGIGIIGSLIFLAFAILKKSTPQQTQLQNLNPIDNWKPLDKIPSVEQFDQLKLTIEQRQLSPTMPVQSNLNPIVERLKPSEQITHHTQVKQQTMTQVMENEEDWEFKTDNKGKIIGVKVHRKLFSKE